MQILVVLHKTNSLKNLCQENIFEHIFLSRAFIPKISNTTTITRIGQCPVHESVVNNVSYFFFQTFTVPISNEDGSTTLQQQKFTFSLSSIEEQNGPQGSFECLESKRPG